LRTFQEEHDPNDDERFNKLIRDEKGEVNVVAIVVLIGIAIALAVIFREAIGNLLRELINMITGKAKTAIE
jgi:flagellin-like protein